jgi:amino acid adenylation domain-containing protein
MQAIWLAEQVAAGPGYGVHFELRCERRIEPQAVRRALDRLFERHESMRSRWHLVEGELRMLPSALPLPLEHVDLALAPIADQDRTLAVRIRAAEARRADLARDPPLRTTLVDLGPRGSRLLLDSHHITVDGASLMILARELVLLVEDQPLPPVGGSFAEHAVAEAQWLESHGPAEREWWARQLRDWPYPPHPARSPRRGHLARLDLDPTTTEALHALARQQGCTPYRALFASFAGMLALRGSGPELALGVFHGGRDLPGSKGLLGTFVNIVPVRIAVGSQPTLRALMQASQQAVGLALAHGRLPHPELRALSPDPGQPLVRVIIGAQLAPEGLDLLPGWRLHLRSLDCAPDDSARFEMKVKSARTPDGGLWVELEVDSDRFAPGSAEQMLDGVREVIVQGLADPDRPLVLREPAPPSLLHQLEAQVRRDPQAIAVIMGDRTLSYGELWGRAMALAARLRAQGAGPDEVVGLLCGRGPELLVGIWGILASGAAWIPVDPSLPQARRELMLADAGARLVLGEEDLWPAPGDEPLPPQPGPQALAYVLSTSGSTGRPKGVEIERGAIEHLLAEMALIWRPSPGRRVAATTNASFDISMVELLFPLLHGASIRLFDAREIRDPQLMAAALDEVDLIQATPTWFSLLLRAGWRPLPTQTIFSAGEALPLDLARTLSAQAPLWNLYGPTEATVFATAWKVPARPEAIRIGRALPGYRTLIDPQGELLIGGIGLARGYRGQPELSAERFIDGGPFGLPGQRLYRSGDLCRLDEYGEIEHLGRLDDQVKIRGNRVELGEIEAALRALPGIQQAVAAPWRDEELGDRVLAWYQPGPQDPGEEALREALARTLPEYMVPSRLLAVAEIPRNQAGKADRKALPRPGAVQASREDGLVARIAAVMAAVIGRPEIDPRRGFFELGGSSIQLVVCAQRLGVELGRPVRVAELFDHPSAERLAASLEFKGVAPPATLTSTSTSEPLAIVGTSCRLPGGVHSAEQLRRLLWEGVDAIGPVPPGRWDADVLGPEGSGLLPTRLGGFVHDILRFDAAAFGLSPREAAAMDPQHRLALELAFEAIENGAIRPDELAGQQVGVFLGLCGTDYQGRAVWRPHLQDIDPLSATGSVHSTAAGRIAHQLDLRGPAMVVDTACSSSLVAAHLAAASLRRGECELALVGGVNVVLSPRWGVAFSALGLLSPSGRCQAFGAGADGYVRAEGGGFLLLAPLSVAQRRGWPVAALLRGSAINHDGRAASLTAPNGLAQRAVIGAALRDAGIDAHQLQAVEAHGTGTELGDPIEVGALAAALGRDNPQAPPLHLGSIKSNLGHLEGAAGITGLLKAVLAVQAPTLPPTLHASPGNRHIPWTELAIRPLVEATPWPEGTRRMGVGSFGFSGTNAWAVVEQAPQRQPLVPAAGPHLLRLSARSDSALNALAQRLLEHLHAEQPDLASFCWTLAQARQPRPFTASGLVADLDQARALLRGDRLGPAAPPSRPRSPAPASLLALPGEPFEGSLLSLPEPLAEDGRRLDHPLLQRQVALAEGLFLFEGRLDLALLPELRDHRVDGQAFFPAVGTWEALRRAGEALLGQPEIELGELSLLQPLVLPEQGAVRLQILLRPLPDGRFQASMSARREQGQEAWTLHARATVGAGSFAQELPLPVLEDGAAGGGGVLRLARRRRGRLRAGLPRAGGPAARRQGRVGQPVPAALGPGFMARHGPSCPARRCLAGRGRAAARTQPDPDAAGRGRAHPAGAGAHRPRRAVPGRGRGRAGSRPPAGLRRSGSGAAPRRWPALASRPETRPGRGGAGLDPPLGGGQAERGAA